jgi:hypothetical protein
MRVTVCRSTDRTITAVLRALENGDRRRLILQVPWTQLPTETFLEVRDQLSPEERRALIAAFDLDQPWTAKAKRPRFPRCGGRFTSIRVWNDPQPDSALRKRSASARSFAARSRARSACSLACSASDPP